MAAGLTLDSGALIAAEKDDRRFWALWSRALDRGAHITVPAVVIAQVWRGNSPVIARLLPACDIEDLDETSAKRAGELLARSRTSDAIDAVVAQGAIARSDTIITSDGDDITRLLAAAGGKISVLRV